MRFFTNENKDDGTEGKDVDVKERGHHPDSTDTSDTVALPQQRGNSPWSSTPDTDPAGSHRRDDEPLIEDPTPPDHAVADTAPDATPAGSGPAAGSGIAAVPHAPAADRTPDTGDPDRTDDHDDRDDRDKSPGSTLQDDGGFDDPKVVDPETREDATLEDDGSFDDPRAVDPVTEKPLTGETEAATEPPAEPAKPGEVPAPAVASIFGADDAKAFQERWREVQLKFVDSPREATAEAATLVDDAVEKLTASLRGQKDQFRGENTEDTEKLRVELRGYREIFNRIIGL